MEGREERGRMRREEGGKEESVQKSKVVNADCERDSRSSFLAHGYGRPRLDTDCNTRRLLTCTYNGFCHFVVFWRK